MFKWIREGVKRQKQVLVTTIVLLLIMALGVALGFTILVVADVVVAPPQFWYVY